MRPNPAQFSLVILSLAMTGTEALAAKPVPKGDTSLQQMNKEIMIQQAPAEVKQELVAPVVKPEPAPKKVAPQKFEAIQKPVKVPAPANKPELKLSTPPAVEQPKVSKVPQPAINKVPRNKFENANAVRQADQARGVKDAAAMGDAMRNVLGAPQHDGNIKPELGLGHQGGLTGPGGKEMDLSKLPGHEGGGLESAFDMPAPTTPDPGLANAGKGPGNAPVGPASSPKEAMQGAAANWPWEDDGETVRLPLAEMDKDSVSGGKFSHTESGGSVRLSNGSTRTTFFHRNTDGSYTRQDNTVDREGNVTTRYRHYGPNQEHDPETDDVTIRDEGDGGIAELQGTEGGSNSGKWARWAARISGRKPDTSLKDPNRVNPGRDGATPNPQAPRLVPGDDQLVINPNPDNVSGEGALPDAAEYRERLQDKIKGPGGHPGNDPEVNAPQ